MHVRLQVRFGCIWDAFWMRFRVRLKCVLVKCVLGSVCDFFVRGVCSLVRCISLLDSASPAPFRSPRTDPPTDPATDPQRTPERTPRRVPQTGPPGGSPNPRFPREGCVVNPFLQIRFWIRFGGPLGIRWGIRSGTQFVFGSVSGSSPGESAFWDGFWSPSPTTILRLPLPFTNRNPQHEPRDSKTHLQTDPKTHSQTNPKTHFKRIQRDPKCIPKRIQIGSPNGSETNI